MVLLSHAAMPYKDNFFKLFFFGTSGVIFFFILSGFIIYYVNHDLISKPQEFTQYLFKRLSRIYPAYWIYTIIFILLSAIFFHFYGSHLIADKSLNSWNIIKSLSLIPYNKVMNNWPLIPTAWTLSYEILFYLAFGLLIINAKFKYLLSLWLLAILFFFISGYQFNNYLIQFLMSPEILLFAGGATAAYFCLNYKLNGKLFLLLGIVFLILAFLNSYFNFLEIDRIISLGIPYLLIVCGGALSWQPKNKLGIFFGNASYTIYLVHYWILGLFYELVTIPKSLSTQIILFIVATITALLVSSIFYKIVEEPILKLRQVIKTRRYFVKFSFAK